MPNPFTDATTPEDWEAAARGFVANPFAKGVGTPQVFSTPGKMPCKSFGLPSRSSCPGYEYSMQRLPNGDWMFPKAICFLCYATGSEKFYTPGEEGLDADQKLTQAFKQGIAFAHEYHMALTMSPDFVDNMVLAISRMRKTKNNDTDFFRLHWCGDMYSAEYCRKWAAICKALPDTRFWVPTRAWVVPEILRELRKLNKLPNVNVRPSAIEFDDPPPKIVGLSAGSTGHLHGYRPKFTREGIKYQMPGGPGEEAMSRQAFLCPGTTGESKTCNGATGEDGRKPCRACWNKRLPVSYRQH